MRNLVVSKTFDDFAKSTDEIDFSQEDLVSYCEELTDEIYWINIESIWGRVGFEWDTYDDYGHFNVNPVKFSILPRIPDPHRLKSFKGLFRNLKSNITIQENDFVNIGTIGNWFGSSANHVVSSYIVKIYLSDKVNITSVGEGVPGSTFWNPGTIHCIGSLENVTNIKDANKFIVSNENVGILKLPILQVYNNPTNGNRYDGDYNIVFNDIDQCTNGTDLSQMCKEIPDDFVYTNSLNNCIPSITVQGYKALEKPVYKMYKVVTPTHRFLDSFLVQYCGDCDDNGVPSRKYYYYVKYDLNGHQDLPLCISSQVNRLLGGINTIVEFSQEPVHNFYRFCGGTYYDCDFTKDNDQKYNYFINPYNGGDEYYTRSATNITKNKGYCYCGNYILINDVPIKIDVDWKVYKDNCSKINFNRNSTIFYKAVPDFNIDVLYSTPQQVRQSIQTVRTAGKGRFKIDVVPNIIMVFNDINYLPYEGMEEVIVENMVPFSNVNENYFQNCIYINDSIKQFKHIRYKVAILSEDFVTDKIEKLIVPKDNENKITPVDNKLSLTDIYLGQLHIPKLFDYPELHYPINDPENYAYNKEIRTGISFSVFSNIHYYINGQEQKDIKTYINTDQEFIIGGSHYLTATDKGKYSNSLDTIISRNTPVITTLDKIVAFDYGEYNFYFSYFFVDEDNPTVETAEKMTEFVNKCFRNPEYKGKKDIGKITLDTRQYNLLTEEQIDGLIEYGWSIIERKS